MTTDAVDDVPSVGISHDAGERLLTSPRSGGARLEFGLLERCCGAGDWLSNFVKQRGSQFSLSANAGMGALSSSSSPAIRFGIATAGGSCSSSGKLIRRCVPLPANDGGLPSSVLVPIGSSPLCRTASRSGPPVRPAPEQPAV